MSRLLVTRGSCCRHAVYVVGGDLWTKVNHLLSFYRAGWLYPWVSGNCVRYVCICMYVRAVNTTTRSVRKQPYAWETAAVLFVVLFLPLTSPWNSPHPKPMQMDVNGLVPGDTAGWNIAKNVGRCHKISFKPTAEHQKHV